MAKKMTLDELGRMVECGFEEIRSTMVTKTEFKEELVRIWDELRVIRSEMATKKDLHDFARSWAAEVVGLQEEVKELRARVSALEGKKGRHS